MQYISRCLMIFSSALAVYSAGAQTNASPYSIAGIGDIESGYFDRSAGMANTGVSLSSNRFQYQANPASLAGLDDYFFALELTGRYKNISYTGKPISTTGTSSADLQVGRLALALKAQKWWGIGVGLMPFSSSNYSFYSKKDIEGSGDYTDAYYEGSGGVNQAYITNSIRPFKNFSIGLQTSFLFGSLSQTETLGYNTNSPIASTRDIYLSKIFLKAGLQYKLKLAKKWQFAVGATASNKTQLTADYTLNVKEGTTAIVTDKELQETYFKLPVMYSFGGALIFDKKITISADFQQQNWNDIKYSGLNYRLVNSNRISGGIEYSKKINLTNGTFEKWFVQGGAFYSNSYLMIKGQQLDQKGFTVGAGFTPLRSPQLALQANLEFGKRGTTANNLIKENYTQASISVFYRDFWYTKVKRYD